MTSILFAGLFAIAVRTLSAADVWWHLQAGRVAGESGRPLQSDAFSHTRPGAPWVNHSWFTEVVLIKLCSWGGYQI